MFESNDTFVEDAVKVKLSGADRAKNNGLIAVSLLLLWATISITGAARLIVAVLFVICAVITVIVLMNRNIEYEYDYTNGSLEIAKIVDNSKRKKIVSIESAELRMVAAVGTNESLKYDNVKLKTYDCSAHDPNIKTYILVAHSEAKGNDFKVIFNPSEKLINAMMKYNKREIYQ